MDFENFKQPLDQHERKKRKREWIFAILLLLAFVGLTIAEFRLTNLSSSLPFVNSIFFFGLLNINIVILLALLWLIFRNIGKVFLERRQNVLGSRLKSKLIIAFLAFSIIPTLMLFMISAMYINSSFDKWFSIKIQNTLEASLEISRAYYRHTDQTANHFAEHLVKGFKKKGFLDEFSLERTHYTELNKLSFLTKPELLQYFTEQRELLAIDTVEFYFDSIGERIYSQSKIDALHSNYFEVPRLPIDQILRAFNGDKFCFLVHISNGDLVRCVVPVEHHKQVWGVVVVGIFLPVTLVTKVGEITNSIEDYRETNPLKYPMKTTYLVILIMITLVIIFVAIWIGLYLARELTIPVERLVTGAQQVGAGNLDTKVLGSGQDEIAVLIDSFNQMTSQLKENRTRLTETAVDLESRKQQLEVVLSKISAGVAVVERKGYVSTFNSAISKHLGINYSVGQSHSDRKTYTDIFGGPLFPLAELVAKQFDAQLGYQGETLLLNLQENGLSKSISVTATALRLSDNGDIWGVVLVVDDLTFINKSQREMAWREVARRIAHEIKNPLTPIKLSAQRLQRRLSEIRGRDGELVQECTSTIIKHTDELKDLVNEFSNFARFPEINPTINNIDLVLKEVVSLYQQAHPSVFFSYQSSQDLPEFEFDRDQIKRMIINLFDNAVGAFSDESKLKQIEIETHYHEQLQIALLTIKDNGPGMDDQIKARVFEPYFSTKPQGTGLGLAIAKRIVNDHNGVMRVQSAVGEGTSFFIELPTSQKTRAKTLS